MADKPPQSSEDDPRERFRRLLSQEDQSLDDTPPSKRQTLPDLPESTDALLAQDGHSLMMEDTKPLSQSFEDGDTAPLDVKKTPEQPAPFGGKPSRPPQVGSPGNQAQDIKLPQRVDEIDVGATQVSSAAYRPRLRSSASQQPDKSGTRKVSVAGKPQSNKPSRSRKPPLDTQNTFGCLLRLTFLGLFGFVFLALCGASILFYQYYRIASTLPDIKDLRQRASQFETTRILDRNGNVLYEILDPSAGRRTYVPLEKISPYMVAATIATEDSGFYSHPGFDVWAIVRAFLQNYQSGETVSGASTITQQLARILLFSPEERAEQTYQRKIREAVLASEITRRYTKDQILELYLNEIFYANLAYGVEAAAETYFRTTADKLTLGQAAFLAGLPQAPAVYDVYTNPEAVFQRLEDVLVLMYQASREQGCIYVSNSDQRICLDAVLVTEASNEIKKYSFEPPNVSIRYPHWVTYVRSLLENQYDSQTIYRSGFTVFTTLDPALQDAAQDAVREQIDSMTAQHATDGALVVIRPSTGEILSMIGSADFYNEEISGQVNMAISPRQPGSAIKPLTYAAAFEKGWTPATLLWDVPSEFPPSGQPTDLRPPYIPVNYDGRYRGPVTVRIALANSLNIPAVKTLQFVGIYDDPATPDEDGLVSFARRMGISTLDRQDYGLSLTLGGGDVTLLELTSAYSAFANSGRRMPPVAITRILDHTGAEIFKYELPIGEQVVRPDHAYLITSILSDNKARSLTFGANSILNLPFPSAAKTGTTNDFRDNWTLGFTPDVAVGVWVGNADYTPMINTSGVSGAAPIWVKMMKKSIEQLTGGNPTNFVRPPGIVEHNICEISGTMPSQWCPQQRTELFTADQPPLPKGQDLWQNVLLDTWTGLLASPTCSEFTDEAFVLNVIDPWARKWIRKDVQGKSWAASVGFTGQVIFAPTRDCTDRDPRPKLSIVTPGNDETITSKPLNIYALVDATQWFDYMRLEYGLGEDPGEWTVLLQGQLRLNQPDLLYTWDLERVPNGVITLRLYLHSTEDTYARVEIRLNVQLPTPTNTPLPTTTSTPVPSPTLTPSSTPGITPTATPTPTSTFGPPPLPTKIITP